MMASSGSTATWWQRGRALFLGREALKARIRGHESDLPAETVRCHNCHVTGGQPQPDGALAPRLDRALLLDVRSRRNGPPSFYGRESFCKLLRTGVDPVYILIAREMPTYNLDDAQCVSLWKFLTDEK
jgi:hypothetical protein